MEINQISDLNFAANPRKGRKLIPLSEYQKPLLKLTKSDNVKIEQLQARRTELAVEQYKISSYVSFRPQMSIDLKRHYQDKLNDLNMEIEDIDNQIRKIKETRYQKQLKKNNNK